MAVYNFNLRLAPGGTTYRYNPGHYASLMRENDSQAAMTAATVSGITKGFIKRWAWLSFETALDDYSAMLTHEMHSDLAYCQARGLKLIAMIEDESYGFANPVINPPYLDSRTANNSHDRTAIGGTQGRTMARWDPYVVTRMKALLTAFAAHFGDHPALEGVMTEETALSIPVADLTTPPPGKVWQAYTAIKYRDALIDVITHWRSVQPDVRWFFYMNFISGTGGGHDSGLYLEDVVEAHKPHLVITGPDAAETAVPGSVLGDLQGRTFWIYRDHKSTCPVMAHLSIPVYSQGLTGEQIYQFVTADLGANYIASIYQGASHVNWTGKVLPMMNAHPTFNVESW